MSRPLSSAIHADICLTMNVKPGPIPAKRVNSSKATISVFGGRTMKQQPRFKTVLMLSCILAVTACNTGKKDDNKSLLPVILALGGLSVGDNYQGGKIAYIFQPGDPGFIEGETHGLIAAESDQGSDAEWGCNLTSIDGTSTDLGTGMANTQAIVDGCGTAGIAARICDELDLNGYTDWYLPSRDELNKLYENRNSIGGFDNDRDYWSSSEFDAGSAWRQRFDDGEQSDTSKEYFPRVRAVRSF